MLVRQNLDDMTIPLAILCIALLTISLTTVFYASKTTQGSVYQRTAIAAIGFLILAITLYLIGALG